MAIFDAHHPWVFTFGVLGNIVSIFVYLAPLPTFITIYRRKSTLGYQSLPYVVALFAAMLWMYYAFLKNDAVLLISINSFGCVIETIYIVIFLAYASKEPRNHTAKLLASLNLGVFSVIFLLTLFLVKGSIRVQVVGWVCVAVSVSVFAAPLSIVFEVVRTRSVEFMPFILSFFLTLSAVMWFAYGLLQRDLCVALPNIFGFFLGMLQMLLYAIYKNAKKAAMEKKLPEHIINIVMLGTSHEVYPVVEAQTTSGINDNEAAEDEKKHEQTDNGHDKSVASPPNDHQPTLTNVHLDSPVLVVSTA